MHDSLLSRTRDPLFVKGDNSVSDKRTRPRDTFGDTSTNTSLATLKARESIRNSRRMKPGRNKNRAMLAEFTTNANRLDDEPSINGKRYFSALEC